MIHLSRAIFLKTTSKWAVAKILVLNLVWIAFTFAHGADRLPGAPLLGIDVNAAQDGDFDAALAAAITAGMQTTGLSVFWDDYETAPNVFQPETNWLAIANLFYSKAGLPISLTISVLDTTTRRLPEDLMGLSFDDPALIARFKNFLDYVFTQIPDLRLTYFGIGNEVDGVLVDNTENWSAYETFFIAAADYTRALRAGTRVGVVIKLDGLVGFAKLFSQSINAHSDVILVTHYPLDGGFRVLDPATVNDSFDEVTGLYPGRPVYFAEIGFQSGTTCGSSEDLQATFVREVFKAWRKHRKQVDLVNFTWLTDISAQAVQEYLDYYGVNDPCFAEYLGTLGLMHRDGSPKPAYQALTEAAAKFAALGSPGTVPVASQLLLD